MDLYLKVKKFLAENAKEKDFTGGIGEEKISKIEQDLQVTLPDSYKWFLRNYGSGGVYGIDLLGYDFGGASVVEKTEEYRKYNKLPSGLVVIEHVDFFGYCLDTNKMNSERECPVIIWSEFGGYKELDSADFIKFLYDRLLEMKDNWEEDEDWED
ncbi:SMI1/KNR4 family protein [Bacillus atrophaeus]|uniref:SMI1/KNR4 family protein n=1 Tax=Bacillus atrophaeus TaxID=1452 RepID=UPI002E20356D|nr:SMI1/KNR4 family protein [Bacillus atrophaeus]MED4823215.1 SMI1/KNR4 family protein [Bacillus atrophaeus]MED4842765.1 SMI1/KNR4 family protein [Bacillus atrophaeus]MED4848161.1 SMI1/KNR4 family protein [Bacillus atrophaeus]MED4854746.1 SMI1/KNR4 family protein [Bacillus atrophaeus]